MPRRSPNRFVFRGGDPCLDFVNTEIVSLTEGRLDLLEDFSDLLDWLAQTGLVSRREAEGLGREWSNTPAARRTLAWAQRLRSELRGTMEGLARRHPVRSSTIHLLNRVLRARGLVEQLVKTNGRLEKKTIAVFRRPADALQPLAQAAANLLTSPRVSQVRHCEGPGCILFFLDTTRNHSRRWCSMEGCGNRVKVAEHRKRQTQR